MAKLTRKGAFKKSGRGSRPQDKFLDWLEENQHRFFCPYCLLSRDDSEIEHYNPEAYLKPLGKNPHTPQNLYLACHDCNDGKLDYHPKNSTTRKRLPKTKDKFRVLNAFRHDLVRFYSFDKDGFPVGNQNLTKSHKEDVEGSTLLLGLDQRVETAKDRIHLIKSAQILEKMVSSLDMAALEYNLDACHAARLVWCNRLFFIAMQIKLSKPLLKFAQKNWHAWKAHRRLRY